MNGIRSRGAYGEFNAKGKARLRIYGRKTI